MAQKALLDCFWKLCNDNDSQRIDAATRIISSLASKKEEVSSDVSYCVERIVRGLASNRAPSIQGFFICLVELFKNPKIVELYPMDKFRSVVDKILQIKGGKSDKGEMMRGQMFCYGAILRSGCVQKEKLHEVLSILLQIASQRSYLAIPAYKFVMEAISLVSESDFMAFLWPTMQHNFMQESNLSFGKLWLLLEIHSRFPKATSKPFPMQAFSTNKLISEQLTQRMSDLLLNGAVSIRVLTQTPLLSLFLRETEAVKMTKVFWKQQFVPSVVKSSVFKCSVAMIVLDTLIPLLSDPVDLTYLVTDDVIQWYVYHFGKSEKGLPEIKQVFLRTFDKIIGLAREHDSLQMPMLAVLLTRSGSVAFDKVTDTAIVHKLISVCKLEAVKYAAQILMQALDGRLEGVSSKDRAYAAHQLAKLILHPATMTELTWKVDTMSFLFAISLLDIRKPIGIMKRVPEPLSREARMEVKTAFFKSLDVKASSLDILSDLLLGVAENVSQFIRKPKVAVLHQALDQVSHTAWEDMLSLVKDIRSSEQKRREDVVFQLLVLHIGFYLFTDASLAMDVLTDLKLCYKKSMQKTSDGPEPAWIDVVVDLLLSLLSQSKSVLRQLVTTVMTVLSPHLTLDSIQTILDVLRPASLTENSDDEDAEDDEDGNQDDQAMQEAVNGNGDLSGSDEDDEDENDEDEEDDEEDDGKEISEEFRLKVQKAMGEHAADSDKESIDMDDMSEEDMRRMDETLTNIFRVMCKQKSSVAKKKEKLSTLATVHFKLRVLDIIDVYLAHQPKLSHVLVMLPDLIHILEDSVKQKQHEPLSNRLVATLVKISGLKKLAHDDLLTNDVFGAILQSLVDLSSSSLSVLGQYGRPFSQCCAFLLKQAPSDVYSSLLDIYDQAIESFFVNSSCLLPVDFFLVPIESGCCRGVWSWTAKFIKYGFEAKTRFCRKLQALICLTAMLRSHVSSEDTTELQTVAAMLVPKLMAALDDCITKTKALKPKFLCELLNLTRAFIVTCEAHLSADDNALLRSKVEAIKSVLPKNRHFQDAKRCFNRLCVLLKIQVVQDSHKSVSLPPEASLAVKSEDSLAEDRNEAPSPEYTESANTAAASKKKGKKKKRNTEALKKKKERKQYELVGQFDGLDMPSFADIVSTSLDTNGDSFVQPPVWRQAKVKRKITEGQNGHAKGGKKASKKLKSS